MSLCVRILYFAGARDLAGVDEEPCELPESVRTIEDFSAFVATLHPELASRMTSIRIARNEAFANGSDILANGDVLALIPPVSGG